MLAMQFPWLPFYYSVAMYPSNRCFHGCSRAFCSVGAGKKCCNSLKELEMKECQGMNIEQDGHLSISVPSEW